MTTVQIVGIAVAAAVVLLLVIALLVTRRRGSTRAEPASVTPRASFLDDAPQDTLSALGKADQPVEDITVDPGVRRQMEPADDETTGELPAARTPAVAAEPARPAVSVPTATEEVAPEPGPGSRRMPLSDIIVTTSNKMVDLQDPEVRRMLTDLVKDEIDQATHYRQQGQTIDAVLQLTEAEKISRALDMRESAAAIRKMMDDLQGKV